MQSQYCVCSLISRTRPLWLGCPTNWTCHPWSKSTSVPVTWAPSLLGILGQLVYWCTIPTVCRLWVKGLDLPACGILYLANPDAFTYTEIGSFWNTLLVCFCTWDPSYDGILISLFLQSPTRVKLHRSTTVLTSWMYPERVLLPWFRALRCMNAAISSDLGLV